MKLCKLICLFLAWYLVLPSEAGEFFVSVKGRFNGDGSINAPWSLAKALGNNDIKPGDTIWLRGGIYPGLFECRLYGETNRSIIIRSYPGEFATIDGSLEVYGASTIIWGLEIRNSLSTRLYKQWARPAGVSVFGPNTKLINLVIHDAGQGVGWWDPAVNSEIYGCLIYNNGNSKLDHGIYAQNRSGTKRLVDNIVFNNFGYGLHIFGSREAALVGFDIRGNTFFNNGSLLGESETQNIIISGEVLIERIALSNNLTYSGSRSGSVSIGSGIENELNGGLEMQHNYLADYLEIRNWRITEFLNNTLVGSGTLVGLLRFPNPSEEWFVWDRNTYISQEVDWKPFQLGGGAVDVTGMLFDQWKSSTGFDTNSTYINGRPSGTKVFLRNNRYEPGRIHVTIYNWDKHDNVMVDLKPFLPIGKRYQVRNAQDYLGDAVLTGIFDGNPIHLPMNGLSVSNPVGLPTPAATGPEFNVFIVLPMPDQIKGVPVEK